MPARAAAPLAANHPLSTVAPVSTTTRVASPAGSGCRRGTAVIAGRTASRRAREVVAPGTDGLAEVVAAFGADVVTEGALDRAALARRVFADPAARERLEKIIHPRVRARVAELSGEAPDGAVVVNDVPLLVEAGLAAT